MNLRWFYENKHELILNKCYHNLLFRKGGYISENCSKWPTNTDILAGVHVCTPVRRLVHRFKCVCESESDTAVNWQTLAASVRQVSNKSERSDWPGEWVWKKLGGRKRAKRKCHIGAGGNVRTSWLLKREAATARREPAVWDREGARGSEPPPLPLLIYTAAYLMQLFPRPLALSAGNREAPPLMQHWFKSHFCLSLNYPLIRRKRVNIRANAPDLVLQHVFWSQLGLLP